MLRLIGAADPDINQSVEHLLPERGNLGLSVFQKLGYSRLDFAHRVTAVSVDDADVASAHAVRAVDHMLQQWAPGERLQDLRQRRMHSLPLAGGKYDDTGVQAWITMTVGADDTAG